MIDSGIQYKIFLTGYETAHKFPTAFLLVSGCVKCQSSPATVSRPSECEIERVWPNCPRRITPLVCSEKNAIDVEVETCEVVTHQDQCAIPERADVDFRRGTRVETANVAEAYGRFVPLAG